MVLRAVRSVYFMRHRASTSWESEPVLFGLRTQYFLRHRSQYFSGYFVWARRQYFPGYRVSILCGFGTSIFRGTEPVLSVNTKPVFPGGTELVLLGVGANTAWGRKPVLHEQPYHWAYFVTRSHCLMGIAVSPSFGARPVLYVVRSQYIFEL